MPMPSCLILTPQSIWQPGPLQAATGTSQRDESDEEETPGWAERPFCSHRHLGGASLRGSSAELPSALAGERRPGRSTALRPGGSTARPGREHRSAQAGPGGCEAGGRLPPASLLPRASWLASYARRESPGHSGCLGTSALSSANTDSAAGARNAPWEIPGGPARIRTHPSPTNGSSGGAEADPPLYLGKVRTASQQRKRLRGRGSRFFKGHETCLQ